jgi:hypothetical protein
MAVARAGHAKDVRPVPLKALCPIEVTASRPVMDVREEASEKACLPIEVTASRPVIDVREEALIKA